MRTKQQELHELPYTEMFISGTNHSPLVSWLVAKGVSDVKLKSNSINYIFSSKSVKRKSDKAFR